MALTCPRCSTNVPDDALYCPYCSLPKPKKGFATPAQEAATTNHPPSMRPSRPARARTPARASTSDARKVERRPRKRTGATARSFGFRVPALGALAAVLCIGVYFYVVPLVYSDTPEAKTVLAAIEKLRRMPSSERGLTIDARLALEIEKSKRAGSLVAYQGWVVKPIKGTRTKVVLSFSFDEAGDVHQRADWLADLRNNTFTPQSELAVSVSGEQ